MVVTSSLARCLQARGLHDEAEDLFQQAATRQTEKLGIQHDNTVMTHFWWATFLDAQKRYEEAVSLWQSVLAVRLEKYGVLD